MSNTSTRVGRVATGRHAYHQARRTALRVVLVKSLAVAALAVAVIGSADARSREQDPTVQKLAELDGRLLRIERILSNQSLLEESQRVDNLTAELRALRGQIEELQHSVETARAQQREMYADLDKRVQALEKRPIAATASPPSNTSPGTPADASTSGSPEGTASASSASAAASGVDDATAYKNAFDLLRDGKYAESEKAFNKFLSNYPQSALADNVHYWLGETHYVNKDFPQALREFKVLVERYPDSRKLPDAWLKIGFCQYELKNWQAARDALVKAKQLGADSTSGHLAEQRLAKMQAEGH